MPLRPLLLLVSLTLLAACSDRGEDPARREKAQSPKGEDATTVTALATPSGPPADQCSASRFQHLIGRFKDELPPFPAGLSVRTACTGCPVTDDLRPDRLNVYYDLKTGLVTSVWCG